MFAEGGESDASPPLETPIVLSPPPAAGYFQSKKGFVQLTEQSLFYWVPVSEWIS